MAQYAVKILKDTVLKQAPIQSSQLPDNKKQAVQAGAAYPIAAYLKMGDHLKFTLQAQAIKGLNTWYAYIPHIQLLKDGKVLDSFENPIQQGHGSREPQKPLVKWIASPNFSSRNGVPVKRIVLHTTATDSLNSVISWFQNPASRVSAHYIISRTGDIFQMVRDGDKAWHAYGENSDTIGIEHVATAAQQLSPQQETAAIALLKWLMSEYKIGASGVTGHRFTPNNQGATTCPNRLFGEPTEQALRNWVNRNLV